MNDYPYRSDPIDQPDPWGYGMRECVSFTGWRGAQRGVPLLHFGNADTWPRDAAIAQLPVDGRAAVGAVVCLPPYVGGAGSVGHVAWVTQVTPRWLIVEDYNWGDTHVYNMHVLYTDPRFNYIHLPVVTKDDDMPIIVNVSGGGGQWLLSGSTYVQLDPPSAQGAAAVLPSITIDANEHANIMKHTRVANP